MTVTLVGSSGVSGAATNGVSVTLTWATAPSAGDIAIVANTTTTTSQPAQTVANNAGTSYTLLISTALNNLRVALWYRVCTSTDTTATCSGSGAAADATAAVGMVFRGVQRTYTPYVSQVKATGTTGQPNSGALTVAHVGDAVISIGQSLANSAVGVTVPGGYLNGISTGASDTRSCQVGMAWVTSTNVSNPLSYDPAAWAGFTSANWIAWTIDLKSSDPYTSTDLTTPFEDDIVMYKKIGVVSY